MPGETIQRFGALTSAERRLVRRLSDKREAAEAVFTALFHAEKAAAAAAQASGTRVMVFFLLCYLEQCYRITVVMFLMLWSLLS